MTSFTWSAMMFLETTDRCALITWWSDWPVCDYRALSIDINNNQKLKFSSCGGLSVSSINSMVVFSLSQWHEIAVSYNAETGDAQVYVDGEVHSQNIGPMALGLPTGPVLMVSRSYNGVPNPSAYKYFNGKWHA